MGMSSASSFDWVRPLGRSNLQTSCLAIGGGARICSPDILYAFDKGIRTFFFSSDLHHFAYAPMVPALRELCGRGSRHRDEVTLMTVTYTRQPRRLLSVFYDLFHELGIETIDVLMWGWSDVGDEASMTEFLDGRHTLVGPQTVPTRWVESVFGTSERLQNQGAVRCLGASFHDMALASYYCGEPALDVAMVRLNATHRSATKILFPELPPRPDRPGIMTFKSMSASSGALFNRPPGWMLDWQPEPSDLYRFPLSFPDVDVVLTGPKNRADIDQSIAAVARGPLTAEEMDLFCRWGDAHRTHDEQRLATASP